MTDKQLNHDVKDAVDEILKQREDAELLKATEEALNKSADKINELVASLEAKDVDLSKFTKKVEELELTVADLVGKNNELQKNLDESKTGFETEKADLLKRAEAAETELQTIKKDQLAKARFEELKVAGVSATEAKAVEDQIAKIREMTDEVFASYKNERLELRQAILAEIEKQPAPAAEVPAVEKTVDEVAAEQKPDAAESKADEVEVASSKEPIEPMKAIAAMFNMESLPGADVVSKYRELGKAMAEGIKNRRRGSK